MFDLKCQTEGRIHLVFRAASQVLELYNHDP